MPSSRPNQIAGRTGRTCAALRAFVAALALAAVAVPAGAAKVVDVRVGLHKSFTRVVLETDAPTRYRIERSAAGEIQVHVDAAATSRRVSTRSKILREVRLVPGQDETVARLRLRGAEVKIQELILLDPPRIVLDLRPAPTLKAEAPEATAPKGVEHPKTSPPVSKPKPPTPTPESLAEAAEREAAKQRAALAAERQAAREKAAAEARAADAADAKALADQKAAELARARAAEAQAAEAVRKEAEAAKARAAEIARLKEAELERQKRAETEAARKQAAEIAARLEAAEAARQQEKAEADALAAEAAREVQQLAEAGTGTEPGTPGSAALAPADPGTPAGPSTRADRPDAMARAVPPSPARPPATRPSPEATESSSGLGSYLTDPVVLGALGLAVVLGIGIVIHQRRSGREDDFVSPVHDDEPFSIEEGAVEDEAESSAGDAGESEHVPVPDVASGDASAQDEEAGAVNTEIGMDSMDTGFSPGVAGGANADLMRMVQELERRLTVVEKKLEETTEAKERLERQVAAQTEELRVQRSAIARTQRALRSIARPEEEATEPVPKG